MTNSLKILGVRIDNLSKKEILEKIVSFLDEERFHQVATINPEFILEAQKNDASQEILNSCDLNVADGFGISCAFLRNFERLKCRFAGADLMMEILRIANEKNLNIFLATNKDGLSTFKEIKGAILKIYPSLGIFGTDLDKNDPSCMMPDASYSILFCNFGHPYQEIFINRQKCGNIRLAMGVGGSFDYLTGKVARAPRFMRTLGIEWLFRLFKQPKRAGRIFQAVIVFPIKVTFSKYNG